MFCSADGLGITPTQKEAYKEKYVKAIDEQVAEESALLLFFRPTMIDGNNYMFDMKMKKLDHY